jgi:hypothetical protein
VQFVLSETFGANRVQPCGQKLRNRLLLRSRTKSFCKPALQLVELPARLRLCSAIGARLLPAPVFVVPNRHLCDPPPIRSLVDLTFAIGALP